MPSLKLTTNKAIKQANLPISQGTMFVKDKTCKEIKFKFRSKEKEKATRSISPVISPRRDVKQKVKEVLSNKALSK